MFSVRLADEYSLLFTLYWVSKRNVNATFQASHLNARHISDWKNPRDWGDRTSGLMRALEKKGFVKITKGSLTKYGITKTGVEKVEKTHMIGRSD